MQPAHASYVTFEPPDIVHWRLVGNVEAADIMRIYDAQLAFAKDKPHLLVLIDVARLKNITAAARRAAAGGPDPGKKIMSVRGCAVVGANFHFRVLGLLVAKAARVLNPGNEPELHFCDTEAQARVWFEKRRREIG